MLVPFVVSVQGFHHTIQLISLATFDFDLNRRVTYPEVTAKLSGHRLQNLFTASHALLRNQDVTASGQNS